MGRNNEDFAGGAGQPSAYYRWMHKDEYESARKSGSFRPNINVSDVASDEYADEDRIHVKFPAEEGNARKKEDYTGPAGNAYWLNETPFEKSTVVGAGSAKTAKEYGFDDSPREGCLACEHPTAPLRHNHGWS